MRLIALALTCLIMLTAPAIAQPVNPDALLDTKQEALARSIMQEIRCLQCQNQSIIDSNADLAKDLRKLIRLKVKAGMNRNQVKDYLVDRYGDWVLLQPPVKPTTYLLWGSPVLLMLIIALIIIRRRSSPAPTAPNTVLSADEEARLYDLLKDTQDQLRAEDKDIKDKGAEQ